MKQFLFFIGFQLLITLIKSWECKTPGCAAFAKMLKGSMNLSADPCDDFYEYACGRWAEENPIPDGEKRWGFHDKLLKMARKKVMDMWQNDSNASDTGEAFKKARRMYQSCMNLEAIEKDGAKTILSILNTTGGWPMIMSSNEWNPGGISLSELLTYYESTSNLEPLFFIDMDARNVTRSLSIEGVLFTPLGSIWGSTSRNSLNVKRYLSSITQTVKILANEAGNQINENDLEEDIDKLYEFERAMKKISPDSIRRLNRHRRGHSMTVRELQLWHNNQSRSTNSKVIWIQLLQAILNGTGIACTDDYQIVLMEKKYVEKLINLLDNTPLRTIVNYIQWYFVESIIFAASEYLREISAKLDFLKNFWYHPFARSIEQSPRHKTCSEETLDQAVLHEFVKRYLPPSYKTMVKATANKLLNTAHEVFNETSWLATDERKYLQDTLLSIKIHIAYPDWYDEPFAVDEFYEQCVFGDNFMKNVLGFNRCQRIIAFREIAAQRRQDKFPMQPVGLADYNPLSNSIRILPAILQAPMPNADYPLVLQYATLGATVGHEIFHASGPYVIESSIANGLVNWSNEAKSIFNSKVGCFVNQYNNYEIYRTDNRTIYGNGLRTKNEDIPDLHGVKLSYRAYEESKTLEDTNLRLPGLELYTDAQLFFLANAYTQCSSARQEYYKEEAGRNSHSIRKLRVTRSVSNMKEFSAAFHCPKNVRMNPKRKCTMWGTAD